MKLEPLMTLHVISKPVDIGTGPQGTRHVFDVTGGTFQGARLRGTVLPSGGDWLLVDGEGVGRLDVRLTLATDDGAHIYVQYYGIFVFNEKAATALAQGGATAYGETYFMTQPRFETGDARYSWLNRMVAVAEGRLVPSAAEYKCLSWCMGKPRSGGVHQCTKLESYPLRYGFRRGVVMLCLLLLQYKKRPCCSWGFDRG